MSTTNHIPETPTPSSRYPSKLSRNYRSAGQLRQPTGNAARISNNSHNNRGKQRNNNNKRNQYPAPSIDHQSRPIPNRPAPSTNPVIRIKELSSLQELLQQAGYKDTRVCTPEAEKIRQIRKTFEDEEVEELNDLYGTFGLQRKPSTRPIHQIQNVTEPTVPFRSSSAMLRNLALQDSKLNEQEPLSSSPSTWWEGGMAALGKAAKAVVELSPPAKGDIAGGHSELSPAKWNDQIRKAKSDVALSTGSALTRNVTAKEQRPPTATPLHQVPDLSHDGASSSTSKTTITNTFNPPPPSPLDEDAFGYGPLPSGYEAQWDEDSGLFDPRPFEIDSSESYGDSLGGDDEHDLEEAQMIDRDLSEFSSTDTYEEPDEALGRRILQGALEYDDDIESPPATTSPLPDVGIPSDAASDAPIHPHLETDLPMAKRPLKYADRATKLRIAKSTPVLQSKASAGSWMSSWRQAFVGTSTGYQPAQAEPVAQAITGPLKLSPSVPAAPTLVTKSTVVCDSASDSAFDLPPVETHTRPSAGDLLRLRPSIARLKQAVFSTQASTTKSDDVTPTLSPRLDWDTQGEHYAGWNWSTKKQRPAAIDSQPEDAPAPEFKAKGSIDYTKSFFYKPATPPRNLSTGTSRPAPERSTSEPQVRARRSIKSLKAALLLPVAAPPVPQLPAQYSRLRPSSAITPPKRDTIQRPEPPVLAIQSPGAWEAGLPPRALVLEGEEWDAREGNVPGDWGRKASKKGAPRKLKKSSFEF